MNQSFPSRYFALVVFSVMSTQLVVAQTGVSVNSTGAAPNANAILDVSSTTKGALLPRMTTAQRVAFSPTGTSGLTVFDTTTQSYWYWDGNANTWRQIPNTSNMGHNTLDGAYDQGGAGAGRVITADNGAVDIQGSGGLLVNGNVGVGTTSPAQKLHVQVSSGSGLSMPVLIKNSGAINGGGTGSGIGFNNHNAGTDVKAAIFNERISDFGVGKLHFLLSNSSNTTPVSLSDSRMTILSNGNVGIGTSAPSAHLNVEGASNSAGSGSFIIGNTSSTNLRMGYVAGDHTWIQSHGGTPLYINELGNNTIVNSSGGNLGLGTASPSQKLHVVGSGRFSSLAGTGDRLVYANSNGDLVASSPAINTSQMVDGAGAANRVTYWSDANTLTSSSEFLYGSTGNLSVYNAEASTGEVRLGAAWNRPGVYSSTELQLFSDQTGIIFGDSDVERMRMTAVGNFGVGTSAPAEKLHVNGSLRVEDGQLNTGTDNIRFMEGVRADDSSYEWAGFYSGTTRQGIILYDGQWSGANNLTNEFSLTAENGNLLTLNTDGNHVALMPDGSGNVGVGTLSPGFKLHVNGDIHPDGKFVVQNGVDGGNSRGIWMWTAGDANWGIYMGQSGAGRSLSGGTAAAGGGFSAHAIRFRVNNSSTQGFIFENSSESNLFSIRGDNGRATFRGGVLFDCPGCGSTSTVDGSSDWGDLTIQGRVISSSDNLHLSPPGGSKVIINSTYRAAGGGTGTTGLDIEDGGIRMRKNYRWINRYGSTSGYGWGSQTWDLGNWDFCAVGHFGFRNTNSATDEDDDVQCAVYPYNHANSSESTTWDVYFTYQYNAKPRWYMYLEGYADTNATNCAASCMNFE